MQLPTSIPERDPQSLWSLQSYLLELAESHFGKRDQSKKIYQPTFSVDGPYIYNTPSLDGAFVSLGNNSKSYWPTTLYEMAHETVHLLNPIVGYTNFLEEGAAVEFSIYAQEKFLLDTIKTPENDLYYEALELVRALPGGCFSAAHSIRQEYGSLGSVSYEQLLTLFPSSEKATLLRLAEKCIPR
ncbi:MULTISPECIES: hypothetical protein [unclassified Pseudomonas]|uniref:hypothetical protein n=1 Tax=unclassified Pseudomonas TaxID=196821 RepID=UPI0025809545|nr:MULTISPECIES: hypothetical protein [unclassified Pseudomonas]